MKCIYRARQKSVECFVLKPDTCRLVFDINHGQIVQIFKDYEQLFKNSAI